MTKVPTASQMQDGIIELDTDRGKQLGFTSDKFDGWLWLKEDYVCISFIVSLQPNRGNLSKLFNIIQQLGYGIKVPTPFARMKAILISHGFTQTIEDDPNLGPVEVWKKESAKT